jgi:hypothetical protein
MIPYQELRIGNHVLAGEKQQQISMIDQRSSTAALTLVDQSATSAEYPLNSIMPVPLTDDVLKQCGFSYHNHFKFWQLVEGTDEYRSEMDIDTDYNLIDFMRKTVVKKIASLHQLQNIYFLLKGKELTVREATKLTLA